MSSTDCLVAHVLRALHSKPLSAVERKWGRAVRVVSCVRANDPDVKAEPSAFVWSVLALSRAAAPAAPVRLAVTSTVACRLLGKRPSEALLCAEAAFDLEGDGWCVREYAVEVPRALRWFSVRCGVVGERIARNRRNELVRAYFDRINNAAADEEGYAVWLERHRSMLATLPVPADGPLVSIVTPVYKTPPAYLRQMIDSVLAQTYAHWELVIVNASPDDAGVGDVLSSYDDERVRVVPCPENKGIAGNTNIGIAACRGDYVCFLDHDDFVEPQALAAMVGAAQAGEKPVDLVYCDEDSIDHEGRFKNPLFKPGRNIDLLYSNDYVIHWLMVSRFALEHTARSGPEVDGAQDYDLTLRTFELGRGVVRVPFVLYHWRIHPGSMNSNPDSKLYAQESGRRAIEDHLCRRGVEGVVTREPVASTYRTVFPLTRAVPPLTCAVVGEPSAGLSTALDGYRDAGGSVRLERLGADNAVAGLVRAAEACDGLLLLVAGGLEVDAACIATLAGYFARPEVFAVAPRTLLANGLVDCAGCIVRPDGSVCRMGRCLPSSDEGYIGRFHRPYSASVLDGACCMFRAYELAAAGLEGGFATLDYVVADVCLRAFEEGLVNVFTPFATATWSHGRSMLTERACPAEADAALLLSRHPGLVRGDPGHNPNFDPCSPYYLLVDNTGDAAGRACADR